MHCFDSTCRIAIGLIIAFSLSLTTSSNFHFFSSPSLSPFSFLHSLLSRHLISFPFLPSLLFLLFPLILDLTATTGNHLTILEEGGLTSLFSLCNSPDLMSQYYVGCALANFSSSSANHHLIVEQGGTYVLKNKFSTILLVLFC